MSRARTIANFGDGIAADDLDIGQIGGRRNLIINGAMQVAQRGTSFSSVTTTAYHIDRFQTLISGLGTWTISQSTTAPTGFSNSLKYECTTADASPAASDYLAIYHKFEGQNLQHLKKGTANAESVTLSFWVRSNKTGTYQANLNDSDNSRLIGGTYSISSADTWEYKTITYAGDTTGAFNNDNALSLIVEWWMGSGTDFSTGTLPTSWEATDNTDRNASGTVNLADTIGNTFYITGVQLEVGSVATPFEHRSYGEELALCQRYYYNTYPDPQSSGAQNLAAVAGSFNSNDRYEVFVPYPVEMRAIPTVVYYGGRNDVADTANRVAVYNSATLRSYVIEPDIQKKYIAGYFDTNNADGAIRFHATIDAEL